MSNILKQALLQSRVPLVQCQRLRGKINIQRPRAPHYERARMIVATAPIPDEEPPKNATCFVPAKERLGKNIESPYNAIIAREVHNWLQHSRTVGIFHVNSINEDDLFTVRVKLHKQNMHLKIYGKKIIHQAVLNTRYEAIAPLFESSHCFVFSPEENCMAQLLRLTRNIPQMILMAGIVENRLLSRNELMSYAQLPELPLVQAELVNTMNMAACNLVQQLQMHQNNLAYILDVYAKSLAADATKESVASEQTANVSTNQGQPETNVEQPIKEESKEKPE